ncbi:hypothetical protein [Prosthecobacter fusiformis]|nr:hypothetical protein [Prosthecobacter fusiformis]
MDLLRTPLHPELFPQAPPVEPSPWMAEVILKCPAASLKVEREKLNPGAALTEQSRKAKTPHASPAATRELLQEQADTEETPGD